MKRWKEYKNSQLLTTYTTHNLQLSERNPWLEANLNNKGHVYEFGAKELMIKQHARHAFSTKEAQAEEMHKKIEEEVTAKLSA